jgi:hypothetical protein
MGMNEDMSAADGIQAVVRSYASNATSREQQRAADKDAVGVAAGSGGVETNRLEVVGSFACLLLPL